MKVSQRRHRPKDLLGLFFLCERSSTTQPRFRSRWPHPMNILKNGPWTYIDMSLIQPTAAVMYQARSGPLESTSPGNEGREPSSIRALGCKSRQQLRTWTKLSEAQVPNQARQSTIHVSWLTLFGSECPSQWEESWQILLSTCRRHSKIELYWGRYQTITSSLPDYSARN